MFVCFPVLLNLDSRALPELFLFVGSWGFTPLYHVCHSDISLCHHPDHSLSSLLYSFIRSTDILESYAPGSIMDTGVISMKKDEVPASIEQKFQ